MSSNLASVAAAPTAQSTTLDAIDTLIVADAARKVEGDVQSYWAELRGFRATYAEAVLKARAASDPWDPLLALATLKQFDAFGQELLAATTTVERENIVARGEELERTRAYLFPGDEIMLQARVSFADMRDWNVPADVIGAMEKDLLPDLGDQSLAKKRAALNKVFEFNDAWSQHTDEYGRWARRTSWLLLGFLVVALGVSVASIIHGMALYGFIAAGFSGALVSVLSRMPPMLGWGEWSSYTPRMIGRVAAGVAGTFAGGALLAAGVIKVGDYTFDDLLTKTVSPGAVLYVVGLGILFGFTERALTQLQGLVFKQDKKSGASER